MRKITDGMIDELERIRASHNGILYACDVVEYAIQPETELHSCFTWDDEKAASEYRLEEARRIIRIVVTVIDQDKEAIRAYVSLRADRGLEEGGYRTLVDVLGNEEMRARLLIEALDDLKTWENKYRALEELSAIFDVAEQARKIIEQGGRK